ncbi:TlpA disulfide reductase family protein [Hymenobacter radiodurans]|uniref:TlpA disulfide reductase family protein n=1 Tax=Hymenobacter radiodurans TaxID=2496028 RepID=UPI0010583EED|nr:TlpA disulfide reductase family protein [Hymenobacter radiodurans]
MLLLSKKKPPTLVSPRRIASLLMLLSLLACQRTSAPTQLPAKAVAVGYEVNGALLNATAGQKVYLTNAQSLRVDSAVVDTQGRFRLGGKLPAPAVYWLVVSALGEAMPVFLDNETTLRMTADATNLLGTAQVSGSAEAAVLQQLVTAQARRAARTAELIRLQDWTPARWEAASAELTTSTIELVRQHPASAVAPYAVLSLVGGPQNEAFVDSMTSVFNQMQPASPYTQELLARRKALAATAVGQVAPELILPAPNGQPVALSSLRGRYVLIDFWASWCKPCRAQNPHLVQLYQQYKSKGFEVYGVSLDESQERWLKAIATDNLPWVQVSDMRGFKSAAVAAYAAQAIPLTLLLDPQGRILGKSMPKEELSAKLAALLP